MKKVKTFKELQNHPFVSHIDREYQPGVYDNCDFIYILYLVSGKKYDVLDSGMYTAPTKQALINRFYDYEIVSFDVVEA